MLTSASLSALDNTRQPNPHPPPLERASKTELVDCLRHLLKTAGASKLMTPELMDTLADHSAGNYRALVTMASDLLVAAARRDLDRLDHQLFLELYASPAEAPEAPPPKRRRASRRKR